MSYMTIFAISAEVKQVPNALEEAKGNAVFQAQYVALEVIGSFEEAVLKAIPMVRSRFSDDQGQGMATVKEVVNEKEELVGLYFGNTDYSPRGITEIPLVIVQEADFGSIDYLDKFFSVPAMAVKPEAE